MPSSQSGVPGVRSSIEGQARATSRQTGEMRTPVCDLLDIEFPILAFSHCRDVVAAVSKAGGLGVLGAVAFSPEQLDVELAWIEKEVGDRPYGVDVLVPAKYVGVEEGGLSGNDLAGMIPD